jgi:ubiquinone/menaquinone biosynthesis C-methylase UbiE
MAIDWFRRTFSRTQEGDRDPSDPRVQRIVQQAYRKVLEREADDVGLQHYAEKVAAGMSAQELRDVLKQSPEYANKDVNRAALDAIHGARVEWVKALPPAKRILDLGGSSTSDPAGALLQMGYPHQFTELIIVDLPQDDRNSQFRTSALVDAVETPSGTVRYLYRSMADLGDVDDASIDMVVSGESFEHVTPEDGEVILREAHRVLEPDGLLALDTPNRALTKIQMRDLDEEWINPDHKIEYEHHEMLTLFDRYGFAIEVARGLCHLPESARTEVFDPAELISGERQHDDIEKCYLLAYLARRIG